MNIKEIAQLAGVSVSTVSKVMNKKDNDISEATRKKVLEIIEEHHYVPYLKFRENERYNSHLLGLVIKRSNREKENMVMFTQQAAAGKGYNLIVCYTDGSAEEIKKCVDNLLERNAEGILIDSKSYIDCGKKENAVIYLNDTKQFDEKQKVTFYYHLSDAGQLAAEKLIQAGHEKFACIVKKSDKAILEGCKAEFRKNNIDFKPAWIFEGDSMEEIERVGIHQCIGENITAVLCGTEEIACCVSKVLDRTGTIIPDDISLITVGSGKLLDVLGGGISSIELPAKTMCENAVTYLVSMIEENKQVELIRRFSPVYKERQSLDSPAKHRKGDKIIAVGSLNMDITIEVPKIPVNGETQLADKLLVLPGGKGGNQAVGAGKLGGQVYMIGCIGNDADGKNLYGSLTENHVHTEGVVFNTYLQTGKAYINLDREGESSIVVYQGANNKLDTEQIKTYQYLFQGAGYCLLSLEIPRETAEYTIKLCKRNHTKVIVKPSVSVKMRDETLKDITYLVPNEKELHKIVPGDASIEEKAGKLYDMGVENVIVTLGRKGCYLLNEEHSLHFPGAEFEALDTTGGADSFISALAVYLSEGRSLLHSIVFATYAAGITITRYGVQPALPDRKALDVYEEEILSESYKYGRKEKKE